MQLELNSYSFEVIKKGKGETVVLVHGSNSDYRTWEHQQEEFSKKYQTISYSRRYHYPNEKIADGSDYSMAEHVDDLEQLIKNLNGKPVHLIGHSYGGFVCILLAIRNPDLIRSLAITEPPIVTLFLNLPPNPIGILKLLITRPRTAIPIINFATKGLNPATTAAEQNDLDTAFEIATKAILGPASFANLSDERLKQGRVNMIKEELTGSGFLPLDANQLRQIQIPTLIINGENSPVMFHRFVDRLHSLLPNSQRIVISNASHIVHEDNVSDFNSTVLSFLSTH